MERRHPAGGPHAAGSHGGAAAQRMHAAHLLPSRQLGDGLQVVVARQAKPAQHRAHLSGLEACSGVSAEARRVVRVELAARLALHGAGLLGSAYVAPLPARPSGPQVGG